MGNVKSNIIVIWFKNLTKGYNELLNHNKTNDTIFTQNKYSNNSAPWVSGTSN
jgi:hypothetical protein